VVDGYKSAAHTDSPDGGTGKKTCLGGGMHNALSQRFWLLNEMTFNLDILIDMLVHFVA